MDIVYVNDIIYGIYKCDERIFIGAPIVHKLYYACKNKLNNEEKQNK